jgi:hypothetical protein
VSSFSIGFWCRHVLITVSVAVVADGFLSSLRVIIIIVSSFKVAPCRKSYILCLLFCVADLLGQLRSLGTLLQGRYHGMLTYTMMLLDWVFMPAAVRTAFFGMWPMASFQSSPSSPCQHVWPCLENSVQYYRVSVRIRIPQLREPVICPKKMPDGIPLTILSPNIWMYHLCSLLSQTLFDINMQSREPTS